MTSAPADDWSLVPFEVAHLPMVQPWFDDPETQRWLGGPDWPEMMLRLQTAFQPGQQFRGRIVLDSHAFVLVDATGQPRALVTGDLYDRRTVYTGEGSDGPTFADEPGPHRPTSGFAFVVDPSHRRQGVGASAVSAYMAHPSLATAEMFEAGIEPDNIASRRLIERLGFTLDSETPDWEEMLNYYNIVVAGPAPANRAPAR